MNSKFRKTILGVFGGIFILFLSFLMSTSNTEKKVDAAVQDITSLEGSGSGNSSFCMTNADYPSVCIPMITMKYGMVTLESSGNNFEVLYRNLTISLSNYGNTSLSGYIYSTSITKTKNGSTTTVASGLTSKTISGENFSDFATYQIVVKIGYRGISGSITSSTRTLVLTNTSKPSITYNGTTYTSSTHLFKNNLSSTHTISVSPQFEIQKCSSYDYFTYSRDGITNGPGITYDGCSTINAFKEYNSSNKTVTYSNRTFALTTITDDVKMSFYIKVTNTVTGDYIHFSVQFRSYPPTLQYYYSYINHTATMKESGEVLDNCIIKLGSSTFDREMNSTIDFIRLNGTLLSETEFLNEAKNLADGSYTVYIQDVFGNGVTYSFSIKNLKPEITINRGVTTGSYIDPTSSSIDGSVYDRHIYAIDITTGTSSTQATTYSLCSNVYNSENKCNSSTSFSINTISNSYVVITAYDKAGNSYSRSFTKDTTPPVLTANFSYNSEAIAPGYVFYVNADLVMRYVIEGTLHDNMCFNDLGDSNVSFTIRSGLSSFVDYGNHCIEDSMMETLIVDEHAKYAIVEAEDNAGNKSTTKINFDYELPKLYSYSRYTSIDSSSIYYNSANIFTSDYDDKIYFENGKTYELGMGTTYIYASDDVEIEGVYKGNTKLASSSSYVLTRGQDYTIMVIDKTGNSIKVYFDGTIAETTMLGAKFNDSYDSRSIDITYETDNTELRKHKFIVSYFSIVKSSSSTSYTYIHDFEFMMYAGVDYSYGSGLQTASLTLPEFDEFDVYRTKRVSTAASSFTSTNFTGKGPYYHDVLTIIGVNDIEPLLSAQYGSLSFLAIEHYEAPEDSDYFVLASQWVVDVIDQNFTVNGYEENDQKFGGPNLDLNLKVSKGTMEKVQICKIEDKKVVVNCSNSSVIPVDTTISSSSYEISVSNYASFVSGRYLAYIVDSNGFVMTRTFFLDLDGPSIETSGGLTFDISDGIVVIADKYASDYKIDFIDDMSKTSTEIKYDITNSLGYVIEADSGVSSLIFGSTGQEAPRDDWMCIEIAEVYDEFGNGVDSLTIYLNLSLNPSGALFDVTAAGRSVTSAGFYKNSWNGLTLEGYVVPWDRGNQGFDIKVSMTPISTDARLTALREKNERVIISYKRVNGDYVNEELSFGNYNIVTKYGFNSILNNMVTVCVHDLNGRIHTFNILFVNPNDTSIIINDVTYDGRRNIALKSIGFDWRFPCNSSIESIKFKDTETGKIISYTVGSITEPNTTFEVTITTIFGYEYYFSITLDTTAPALYEYKEDGNLGQDFRALVANSGEFVNTSFAFGFDESVNLNIYGVYAYDYSDFGNENSFTNPVFRYNMDFVGGDVVPLAELLSGYYKVGQLYSLKIVLEDEVGNSSTYYFMLSNGIYYSEYGHINCITINGSSYCVTGEHVVYGFTHFNATVYNDLLIEYPTNPVVEGFDKSVNLYESLTYTIGGNESSLEDDILIGAPNTVYIQFVDVFGNILTLTVTVSEGFDLGDNGVEGISITVSITNETLPVFSNAIYYVESGNRIFIEHIDEMTVDCYLNDKNGNYVLTHEDINGSVILTEGLWKIHVMLGVDALNLYIYVSDTPMMNVYNYYTGNSFTWNASYVFESSDVLVHTLYEGLKDGFYNWINGSDIDDNFALYNKNGIVELVLSYDNLQVSGHFNVKFNDGVGPELPIENIESNDGVYDSDIVVDDYLGEITWIAAERNSTIDLKYSGYVDSVTVVELDVAFDGSVSLVSDTVCSNNVCSFSKEGLYLVVAEDEARNVSEHQVAIMFLTPNISITPKGYQHQDERHTSSIKSNNVVIKDANYDKGEHYKVRFDENDDTLNLNLVNKDGKLRSYYDFDGLEITFASALPEIGTEIEINYQINDSITQINLFENNPSEFMKTAISYSTGMSFDSIITDGLPMTDADGQTLVNVSKDRKLITTLSNGAAYIDSNVISVDLDTLFAPIDDDDIKQEIISYNKKGFVSTNTFDSEDVMHEGLYRHGITLNRSADDVIKLELINVGKEYKDAVFGLNDLEVPIKVDISAIDFGGIEEIDSNNSFENKGLITLGVWKEELFFERKKALL